jgi:DNA topoisomerase-1
VVKEDRPGKERTFKEMVLKNETISEKEGKETYGTEKVNSSLLQLVWL